MTYADIPSGDREPDRDRSVSPGIPGCPPRTPVETRIEGGSNMPFGLGPLIGRWIRRRGERKRLQDIQASLEDHDLTRADLDTLRPYVTCVLKAGGTGATIASYGARFLVAPLLLLLAAGVTAHSALGGVLFAALPLGVWYMGGKLQERNETAERIGRMLKENPQGLIDRGRELFPDVERDFSEQG